MSRRTDAARRALGWLTRGALLGLWAFVAWGTLLLLVTLTGTVTEGPTAALDRLLPGPGSGPWGWMNAAAAALAVAAWLVLAGLLVLWWRDATTTAVGTDAEGPAGEPKDPEGHGDPPARPPTTP